MNFPCPNKTACVCDPNPVTNFSSELPDQFNFLGIEWYFPPPVIGDPGPGTSLQPSCVAFSPRSQEDANLAAAVCSYPRGPTDTPNGGGNGFPTTPSPVFFNTAQSCSHTCPDGSTFIYTVPAGSFISYNQTLSDEMAHSLACKNANNLHNCFIPPTPSCCLGSFYSSSITVPLPAAPITFDIISGSLPAGLTDNTSTDGTTFLIEGTPTTAGNSTFTLMATDANGNTMTGTYTIAVYGLTNAPTDASVGTPYSFQLTVGGGTSPSTFSIISGSLPPGLSMDSAGLITGTPTLTESDLVTFQFTDSSSPPITCTKELTVTAAAPCIDWTTLLWAVPFTGGTFGGGAGFVPNAIASDSFAANATAPGPSGTAACQNTATVTYNGPDCFCKCDFTLGRLGLESDNGAAIFVSIPAVPIITILNATSIPITDGFHSVPFTVPDTGGIPKVITITVQLQCNRAFANIEDKQILLSGQFAPA